MSGVEKRIEEAVRRAHMVESEKADAMLCSIEAIHGKTVRDAVECVAELVAKQAAFLRVAFKVCPIPGDVMQQVHAPIDGATGEVARVMLHLAMTGSIPQCDSERCCCDPKVNEVKKILSALVQMSISEQDALASEIEGILNQ